MKKLIAFAIATAMASGAYAHGHDDHGYGRDVGEQYEQMIRAKSEELFGIARPLDESSSMSLTQQQAEAHPAKLLTVAAGLRVRVVSAASNLAPDIDQMVLWPNDFAPTHIIACNEQGSSQVGVQRIRLQDGGVENIISSGLSSCDPIRRTPWGTIVAGEEAGTKGRIIEILDPVHTTNVAVPASGFGATSDPTHVVSRPALGQFSFEGLGILPNGVVYYTDENRPGSGGLGNPGGAVVKFIPSTLWNPSNPSIASLDQSPWAAGSIYGLRLGRNGNNTDVGQGNEYGRGVWVEITGTAPINLRAAAKDLKLTSFYRPEDMSVDLKALKEGNVRVCGTNTGQDVPGLEGDNHWGEVYCLTDESVEAASATAIDTGINIASIPEYQPLILGTGDFAMPDNIDIQPGRGLFVMTEDGEGPIYSPPRNNDIWACLDDGEDSDHLSDGCIKAATLNDLTAEPTGGFFDGTGRRYFISIQHNITGHGVVLEVTGWQPNRGWFGGW